MAFDILVVDDSETVRSVIAKTLRLAGIPVNKLHEAGNGQQALKVLEDSWIDLVISDINMPVMSGIELIDRMSEDNLLKTVPVVLISVEGSTPRIDQLRAKGIVAFLRKPITPERLKEVLDEALSARLRTDYREVVQQVFGQILEQFAFMFGEPVSSDLLPDDEVDAVEVAMTFTGWLSGELVLAVPKALCPEIAANVLGAEMGDGKVRKGGYDAIKEVLNITCGQLMTALAGDQPVFDLTVPELRELDRAGWLALVDDDRTQPFLVEDRPVLLRLEIQGRSE